ncbi:MAG: 5'/3'-nucleotidase SurE [Pseudomonadota bacterium]
MRILVTNDDGFDAPGLKVAEDIARTMSDDVWVVAPLQDQSGRGHAITITEPMRVRELGEQRFAVSGTPADCVTLGLHQLLPGRPDLVISGVNSGKNTGDDVGYSGTIGAVEEGVLNGVPGIALSQSYKWQAGTKSIPWDVASQHGPALVQKLASLELPPGTFFNVNFPDCGAGQVKGAIITSQGRTQYADSIADRVDGRGQRYFWLVFGHATASAKVGTDRHAIEHGFISVTPLQIDRTNHKLMQDLTEWL